MEKKQISLEVVHPNAAGIDIGSRSHWVAVGQNAEDVKEFGVYSEDQMQMCEWLRSKDVTSIAMESTGTYWQNLFSTLVGQGFDVILVNGRQTKNIRGKKTDIKDCQWIQKLHSLGLLSASFLPNSYQHLQNQINETDKQINELLKNIIDKDGDKKQHIAGKKPHKRKNKNGLNNTDMNQISYQYFEGTDLMAIEGVNESLVMSLMSEVGLEGIKKFESAKQFTAWLRLAPNNKISGGKVLSHHLPKGSSRLKIAFRNTANAIGQLKEGWLVDFFRRINFKKGRATAVSALARKIAVIVWNMVTKGTAYNPPTQYQFLDQKRKLGLVKRIRKQIDKFALTNEDLGFVTI